MTRDNFSPLLTQLRRSEAASIKTAEKRERLIQEVMAQGYSREAVELAAKLMAGDAETEFQTLKQASEILEKSQSIVHIRAVAYAESEKGAPNKSALQRAYETGISHRLAEQPANSCPFTHGPLAQEWLRGWKEAFQVTRRR